MTTTEPRTVLDYGKPDPRDLTYKYELRRAVAAGIIETAAGTFLLLIAVRHFQAGATLKAFIAMGNAGGLIATPLVVYLISLLGTRANIAAAWLTFVAGLMFTIAAAIPNQYVFAFASLLGLVSVASAVPLFTQIYQDNYPEHERGKLFSKVMFVRIFSAATFAYLAGWALDGHLQYYQLLMAVFALAFFYSAHCLRRVPSSPLATEESRNPLAALRFVRDDKTFRMALIAWMLVGLANLIMLPLRIEYLGNEKYGVLLHGEPLSAEFIAILTGVIPNVARLLMSPLWGRLFDKVNFFALRICINIGFAVAIVTFFTGNSLVGLIAGAIIFGISNAGGDVAWSLWVTKVAPPHRVAHYMSVHTFLTGLRGIAAPFIAFYMLNTLTLLQMGLLTSALIVLACLVLIPEIKIYAHRKAPPEVKELPDD